MKIEDATLCLSCEEVFDGNAHLECPVCARGPLYLIKNWLDKKAVKLETEVLKCLLSQL